MRIRNNIKSIEEPIKLESIVFNYKTSEKFMVIAKKDSSYSLLRLESINGGQAGQIIGDSYLSLSDLILYQDIKLLSNNTELLIN